ncbi:MAG: fibrobacter succinogenes major paralogous domain-containing protein [Candidatus Aminicenantes bacterium]|nr:fibrobacter succinogenes major paralogous domain-containing protein [Candidatus Aminicenantes bacterium]
MAENLAYLPQVNRADASQFNGGCSYVYGYDGEDITEAKSKETYKKYGTLYNWDAARESCPSGWHLPSDEEWRELEKYLGMAADELGAREWRQSGEVGRKIKSASGWEINGGRNEFNFHVLPGGCRGYDGFGSLGFCAYFWTASSAGNDNAWRRGFCGDDNGSCREEDRRYFGLSVRCVKDTR